MIKSIVQAMTDSYWQNHAGIELKRRELGIGGDRDTGAVSTEAAIITGLLAAAAAAAGAILIAKAVSNANSVPG